MAKNLRTFEKTTREHAKPQVETRELPPKIKTNHNGAVILCPFCSIPHPIAIGQTSACGTLLRVTAVQTVIPERTVNREKLSCVKCHKSGGVMVPFNAGYVHLVECMPGTKLLATPPKFSVLAKMVYSLPESIRKRVEPYIGSAQQVKEIDPHGVDTGVVLGYFFHKGAQ